MLRQLTRIGLDHDYFQNTHGKRCGGASDCTTSNEVSALSPESTEQIVPGKLRKGNPTPDRSRTTSEGRKHTMAYEWCGEKRCCNALPTSRTMVYSFARCDGCWQPCDDSRTKACAQWRCRSTSTGLWPLIATCFGTYVNADARVVGITAERWGKSPTRSRAPQWAFAARLL